MTLHHILENNEAVILDTIIQNNGVSRAKLSQLTHLSKAAITTLSNKLIDKHLIFETGTEIGSKKGGPKPITLSFNATAGCCLSIEIGNHKLIGCLSYLNGEIIHYQYTDDSVRSFNFNEKLISFIDSLISFAPKTHYGIIGLTLGIHGVVHQNKIVFTPYSDLVKLDIKTLLENKYHFPVWLENEANLVALGEQTFSFPSNQMIAISCHSGIGAGILFNGTIYHGNAGQSGEVGHTILYPNGKPCPCGNNGCLEQYASVSAILTQFKQFKQNESLTLQDFMTALHTGCNYCHQLMLQNAKELAIGITNITLLYNPDVLVLNSPIYREFPEYLDKLKSHINTSFLNKLDIKLDTLGIHAAMYGGISHTISQFLGLSKYILNHEKSLLISQ